MPYASEAQRRYLHAKHPDIAARWDREYPNQGKLPARKPAHGKTRKRRSKTSG